jgi:hypothetical protein
MGKRVDLTGRKFGRLTVIKELDKIDNKYTWLCNCDCGNIKITHSAALSRGDTKSCGCLNKDLQAGKAQLMIKARTQFDPRIAAARYVWRDNGYKELLFEEFYALSQMNCFYCQSAPSNKHNLSCYNNRSAFAKENGIFIYNGLDRIDSLLSHTIDNVVTSCWICNRAKMNRTSEQFLDHINRLINYEKIDIKIHRAKNQLLIIPIDNKYYMSPLKSKFKTYNDGDLTLDQFYQLSQTNCYYCGSSPSNSSNKCNKKSSELAKEQGIFIYNGLDRINSNFPHNYNNLVASCKYCNYAKQRLSLRDFFKWIEKLKAASSLAAI